MGCTVCDCEILCGEHCRAPNIPPFKVVLFSSYSDFLDLPQNFIITFMRLGRDVVKTLAVRGKMPSRSSLNDLIDCA